MNAYAQPPNFTCEDASVDTALEISVVDSEGDSSGSSSSSAEQVLQLLVDMKKLQQQRHFSFRERYGRNDPVAQRVIDNLDEAILATHRLIESAKASGRLLNLQSSLRIGVLQ
ncbi:MAG: hypothetical protein AseanaTS_07420 [Candidatus Pelagadaptatus aseana]|uniref:hypothetical protein n=1 Tax=Candidatus Pelagadaptatus aseana TaxID=3120508 RepID=UPI0039B3636F